MKVQFVYSPVTVKAEMMDKCHGTLGTGNEVGHTSRRNAGNLVRSVNQIHTRSSFPLVSPRERGRDFVSYDLTEVGFLEISLCQV
jgi:hypothetical protein